MSHYSSIEWTNATWNPVTGCTKISVGCKNCYAERMAIRLHAMGNKRYKNGFSLTLHEDLLRKPVHWLKPKMIFVNSMSDLFHEDVPLEFINDVFKTISLADQHIYQILTKRSNRLVRLINNLNWPENLWMGVSVENQSNIYRIRDLSQVPARIRFISCEPLIGPIKYLPLDCIDWVILGGESGPGARPMKTEWVEDILFQCRENKIPFFFKQWGGVRKRSNGRLFNGKIYDEMPQLYAGSDHRYAG